MLQHPIAEKTPDKERAPARQPQRFNGHQRRNGRTLEGFVAARDGPALIPRRTRRRPDLDWTVLEPRGGYARRGKRATDLALLGLVAPLALALAVPIVAINWCLFRELRRVLFVQPRIGHRGRMFRIFKFRTMRPARQGEFDSWRAGSDGLRVTAFGRFLRNTHLDELPQLLNVLRGEMDLVGPRPEMVEIHRWACARIPGFPARNALRPGITALAQVTQVYAGMDVRAYRRKLAADRLYRRKLSPTLDLEILRRTAIWMLLGRGWGWHQTAHPTGKMGSCRTPVSSTTRAASTTIPAPGIPSDRTA